MKYIPSIIIIIGLIVFSLILTDKISDMKAERESYKNPKVAIIMTDTCDYQDGIIYWTANVFVGKEKRRVIIPLDIEKPILDEFKYGDGYYKTTFKKLIEK